MGGLGSGRPYSGAPTCEGYLNIDLAWLRRCRRCHGLHYSSQYQSAGNRAIGRLHALRARLGGSGDHIGPFPPRPKHMQSKTYMRLRALDMELWRRTTVGLASDLESLRRRIAPKGL